MMRRKRSDRVRTGGRERAGGLPCLLLLAGAALAPPACSAEPEPQDDPATRAAMNEIYGAMRWLLPLSTDDEAFRQEAEKPRLRNALATLSEQASSVASHAGSGDRSRRFLADSLAREAREIEERVARGELPAAQFFVQRLSDYCVACHSRLPSAEDSPLAQGFVDGPELAALPAERRAALQIATRRFDDALTTLEGVLADPDTHPAEFLEPLTRYLSVALRVKRDPARPIPVLESLSQRPELWSQLRGDLESWTGTLRLHAEDPEGPPRLTRAEALLDEARAVIRFPSDRRALVHYLLASSELHRWLEASPEARPASRARAYYLLGLVESRVETGPWVQTGDFYLESAVRLAPGSPVAREAFALLEEETLLGWTGSAGMNVPEDVQEHLDELRRLARGG